MDRVETTTRKKRSLALFLVLLTSASIALAIGAVADKDKNNDRDRDDRARAVRITKGPILEFVSDHSAIIAWSNNVGAGTVLRYGTSDRELPQVAETKWGGRTHRVHLTNLRPNTTYYFRVESAHAQGSGTEAEGHVESFHTPAPGQKGEHYPGAGPG